MPDLAIKAKNLSRLYKIGARQAGYKALRESITGKMWTCMKSWMGHN